jgi:hypothetical protein
VLANNSGEFLIPDVGSEKLRICAECDGMMTEARISVEDRPSFLRLVLQDTRPKIASVGAGETGNLDRSPPGSTVPITVSVKDAQKRRLHYLWFPSDAGSVFASKDSPTVSWTLPNANGLNTMHVLVTDENGGHSVGQVSVLAGGPEVIFSGAITDTEGVALAGAHVSINGLSAITNDEGYFFFQLPQQRSHYILNITKDGYALFLGFSLKRSLALNSVS